MRVVFCRLPSCWFRVDLGEINSQAGIGAEMQVVETEQHYVEPEVVIGCFLFWTHEQQAKDHEGLSSGCARTEEYHKKPLSKEVRQHCFLRSPLT